MDVRFIKFTTVDTTQFFCFSKNLIHCLLSMNKRARRCEFCTISKVTQKNAMYKHFKLSQLRDKCFTPFLDNLFLDRMI